MKEYEAVLVIRRSNVQELLNELEDIDLNSLGVKVVLVDDDEFDKYYCYNENL